MPLSHSEPTARPAIDLSKPDNTALVRGRPIWVESLWVFVGSPIFASRLLVSSGLRAWLLRLFGARVGLNVYLKKPGIRVKFPWYLSIGDHSWIGEDAWIDNLAQVTIEANVCVSQGVYLCTGNHDWSTTNMRLFSKPIVLEKGCWVGARSVVCPGVTVAEGAILTAGSVASKSLKPFGIYTGNPAVYVRERLVVA